MVSYELENLKTFFGVFKNVISCTLKKNVSMMQLLAKNHLTIFAKDSIIDT